MVTTVPDPVEGAGRIAYLDGRSERDCPHKDCTDGIEAIDYWQTEAGKRQRWLDGYRHAWRSNVLMQTGRAP